MCKPATWDEVKSDPIHGAIGELISGKSALNMEPKQIPTEELEKLRAEKGVVFLSESDIWTRHAYEHFNAASDFLISYQHSRGGTGFSGCLCSFCKEKRG